MTIDKNSLFPGEVGRVSDPPPYQRVRGGQVDQAEQALRHGQVQLLRLQQVQTFCLHLSHPIIYPGMLGGRASGMYDWPRGCQQAKPHIIGQVDL